MYLFLSDLISKYIVPQDALYHIVNICTICILGFLPHNDSRIRREVQLSMIDYSPFWETIKQKNVTQYALLKNHVIDNRALDALRKNRNLTVLTLEKLCRALDCTPNDIVQFRIDK